jgi:hypothetical protein
MHGIPLEFQITIAEINACRDKSPYAPSWKEIEHKLITWQTRPSEYDPSWESQVIIAWFAVEESWRHTLLVYLYLVSSLGIQALLVHSYPPRRSVVHLQMTRG